MVRHSHSFGTHLADRSAGDAALPALLIPLPQSPAVPGQVPGQATDNWLGDSGAGGNGDWQTAADWSSGTVPADNATANFALGGQFYTVTGDATIGAITIDADALTFDGAVTQNTGNTSTFLTATDGAYVELDSNAVFEGAGGINFADGTLLDVQGTLLTAGGTADTMIVENFGDVVLSSAIDLNSLYVNTGASFTGDVTLNDGGNITLDTSAFFGGGSITLLGSGTIYEALVPGQTSASIFENIAVAASNFLTLAADPGVNFLVGGTITGAGGLVVNLGAIELNTANDFTGGVTIADGASLTSDTTLDFNALTLLTGGTYDGTITLNDGGTLTIDSATTVANSISLLGNATVHEILTAGATSATSDFSVAVAVAGGDTLTFVSDPDVSTVVNGSISGAGAVAVTGGSVELAGQNSFTGGVAVFNASLTVDGQGAVTTGNIILTNATLTTQPDSTGAVNFTDTVVAYGNGDTINALAGNLLVFAGSASTLNFIGGAGTDTIIGDQGALSVTGGSAGDLVFGGNVSLNFTGGTGSSTIVGGSGAVTATGGAGGDLIFGGTSGLDKLYTGTGPSTLVGGAGAQLFATGSANSVLVDGGGAVLNAIASTGNDTLFGGPNGSSDTIFSGAGTSTVVLNGGTTELFTTGTADVFAGSGALTLAYVAGAGGGITNVEDFNVATDSISLAGFAPGTAAQILANETIVGGGTILQIPNGGDQIVLYGVTGLTAANFK
jgi:hypothetical protein